jgi:hypothetical protein
MAAWRDPLLPVGLLLVMIGLGNWYTGGSKSVEYEQLLADGNLPTPMQSIAEFPELDTRTNATLLARLQRGRGESSIAYAKLDFYKVVQSGGRLLILLGLFSAASGLMRSWYRQRSGERGALKPSV